MTKNNYTPIDLPPVERLGDPAYIRDEQVTLTMKQSFGISGADYEIALDGAPALRSKGKAMAMYDEKAISGPSGELFRIKTTSIVPKAFSCHSSAGEVFAIKSKLMSFRTQFTIDTGGAELHLRGNAVSSSATITRGSDTLAEIKRDILSATDLILNGHDYTVTVAPGVDWRLIAGITLCFNDCLNEPRPTGGGRFRRKSKGAETEEWGLEAVAGPADRT